MQFDVTIEMVKGQHTRDHIDRETGWVRMQRYLPAMEGYPADYGVIEGSLRNDHEPLAALVLIAVPLHTGIIVTARPLGMLRMHDHSGDADAVLCVLARDPLWTAITDIDDVPPADLHTITQFFLHRTDADTGGTVVVDEWVDRDAAEAQVCRCIARFRAHLTAGLATTPDRPGYR